MHPCVYACVVVLCESMCVCYACVKQASSLITHDQVKFLRRLEKLSMNIVTSRANITCVDGPDDLACAWSLPR